ncbi:unnamed protein product [Mytilus coruscus]|uniref:Uncharacterized protein n=1 Tax=Mytilus coruscus TaxID=42192 RepID=A0A6J8DTH5_MYTCO|nr:unnamed protein product [Mytilus coruscus]
MAPPGIPSFFHKIYKIDLTSEGKVSILVSPTIPGTNNNIGACNCSEQGCHAPRYPWEKTKPAWPQPDIKEHSVNVGDFMLTDMKKYSDEWPQMGKIITICGLNMEIHWYKGRKSTAWSPCTVPIPGQEGKEETISRNYIKRQDLEEWDSTEYKWLPSKNYQEITRSILE